MEQIIKAAEELFYACPEFKLLADAMPQIVWLADEEGVTYYYNAKWYEAMGSEEGHDKAPYFYSHVLHPDDSNPALLAWQKCVREKVEFNFEYRFKTMKSGGYRWILAKALPVKDPSGKVTWYGTYTDIDEQKKIQEELAAALEFRDEFLSIAGHELKTPLTTLRLQLQLGLRSLKSGREVGLNEHEKMLTTSLKQATRLSSLVEGLLDITQIRKGDFGFAFENADLVPVIQALSLEMKQHFDAAESAIHLDLPSELVARIDGRRIEQVLLNLYMNSVKYAPGADVKITARTKGSQVRILFQDFGPGIEEEMRDRIFERFQRSAGSRHLSGLGLGLYIVKKIIDGHGGEIRLLSRKGEGATFEILLPNHSIS